MTEQQCWQLKCWNMIPLAICCGSWDLDSRPQCLQPGPLQELSAWHLLTPCHCFLGSLARIWREWKVLLQQWERKLDGTGCYPWMLSKAVCAPAEKMSTALLENPVSQQFPGLTLSMQILIYFLPYLPFPHARYRTNSVCGLSSHISHNPIGERSKKRATAGEDVRGTEYSCQGDSLAPAGLIGPELKSPTLRKSWQSQQEAKDNSLLIPEGLNLGLCAAEFFSAHLTGRYVCLPGFSVRVYSPLTFRSAWSLMLESWHWWNMEAMTSWGLSAQSSWTLILSGKCSTCLCGHYRHFVRVTSDIYTWKCPTLQNAAPRHWDPSNLLLTVTNDEV